MYNNYGGVIDMGKPWGYYGCNVCGKVMWDGECNNKAYHETPQYKDMFTEGDDVDVKQFHAVNNKTAMYLVFYSTDEQAANNMLPSLVKDPTDWKVVEIKTETFMG